MKKILLYFMSAFYILAGINHFVNPQFYIDLIPPYFPFKEFINILSGVIEIVLGILLIPNKSRKLAGYAIILMLIAFIPSHVYFIQIGSCIEEGLCVSEIMGWVRLIIIHPLLIAWAYWVAVR